MYNDIITIGFFTIHGYGLMIGIGIFCAFLLADRRTDARKLDVNMLYGMGLTALASGFAGAKLLYCIVELPEIIHDPLLILSGSGFVVYGGIIGGVLGAIIFCRVKKISFLRYFDLAVPSLAIAQGFGRIGCLLAGCCYGAETDSVIGIIFRRSEYAPNNVKLYPTQIMSSIGDFCIAFMLLWYAKKERRPGNIGALYLILYSIGRFVIECFRNDSRGSIGFLSTSQFIALIILALGIVLLIKTFIRAPKQET